MLVIATVTSREAPRRNQERQLACPGSGLVMHKRCSEATPKIWTSHRRRDTKAIERSSIRMEESPLC